MLLPGVVFLFRVGLTLIHCCHHYLLQSDGEVSALEYMVHPPASCLPITPEAFIALAYSFKIKDEDVRKQRIKMEAQVKCQMRKCGFFQFLALPVRKQVELSNLTTEVLICFCVLAFIRIYIILYSMTFVFTVIYFLRCIVNYFPSC